MEEWQQYFEHYSQDHFISLDFQFLLTRLLLTEVVLENKSCGRSLKKLFRKLQSIFPCKTLYYSLAESPRFGEGREQINQSLGSFIFLSFLWKLSARAPMEETYFCNVNNCSLGIKFCSTDKRCEKARGAPVNCLTLCTKGKSAKNMFLNT